MSDAEASSSSKQPTLFRKRPVKTANRRPRGGRTDRTSNDSQPSGSSGEEGGSGDDVIVRPTKRVRNNPMVQSTGRAGALRSQRSKAKADSDDSDGSHDADAGTSAGLHFESSKTGEREGPSDMGATATVQFDTEAGQDAQAVYERSLASQKDTWGKEDDKVYRGIAGYSKFIEVKDRAAGNAASSLVRKGPIRAPDFVRQTVRWDYQPDLCKDFKETGFCTFGDSCKFMHDRTDYKHGWELERDYQSGQYDANDDENYEISDADDDIPFKCFICRESFTNPVKTKCGHYFCEKCALDHYRESKRCYVCNQPTSGIFKPAKEIMEKLKGAEKALEDAPPDGSDSD